MSSYRNSQTSPAAASRSYTKSGIGGIGNFCKTSAAITIPVAPRITITQSSGVFSTGIGGAGNVRESRERSLITPEEILSRSMMRRDSAAQSYHHGIGGAGNRTSLYGDDSLSTSLSSSASSNTSTRRSSGADRLREKFEHSTTQLLQAWQGAPKDSLSLASSASFSEKV